MLSRTTGHRLLCVFAHPDDESLGVGGTLARYASQGVEISLVTATRGEHGWFGEADDYPGPHELGRLREAEFRAAAEANTLGDPSPATVEGGEATWEAIAERLAARLARFEAQDRELGWR